MPKLALADARSITYSGSARGTAGIGAILSSIQLSSNNSPLAFFHGDTASRTFISIIRLVWLDSLIFRTYTPEQLREIRVLWLLLSSNGEEV